MGMLVGNRYNGGAPAGGSGWCCLNKVVANAAVGAGRRSRSAGSEGGRRKGEQKQVITNVTNGLEIRSGIVASSEESSVTAESRLTECEESNPSRY